MTVLDGRPLYDRPGLDGFSGFIGLIRGRNSTSAEWGRLVGHSPSPCQGEGRGFESRRPLNGLFAT